jgi:predicted dehydrogenase
MSSAAALTAASSAIATPSDTVRIAQVGTGLKNPGGLGRGREHLLAWAKVPNVEVVAICDIDQTHAAAGVDMVVQNGGKKPQVYTDFRKLLEDKSIDAVSIATPNHWHALMTVWACQAGKDVYVEKPCTHNVFESRQVVAAARKYNRMVQQGSQSRSLVVFREAVQKLREGLVGDLYLSRGVCYRWRDTIGHTPVSEVPPGVDYDLWTGPAPKKPFTMNRFHYNWHWFWDFGNGDLGNQGIHQVDIARWGLGVKYPVKATAMGGHFMFDDDQETPNTIACAFEFNENGRRQMLEFEVRHWITNKEISAQGTANLYYGSKGYLTLDGSGYKSFLGKEQTPGDARRGSGREGDHFANFIDAVRSRKRETLNAEIEEGAASTILVHLANISYRLGRTVNFDPRTLTITGDAEAARMMTRDYRKPFVVPEKV